MIVLGIDPGTRKAGFSVIQSESGKLLRLASGVIILENEKTMSLRLAKLHEVIRGVISEYKPDESAVEKVFFGVNAKAALALGQGRGAALSAIGGFSIPVFEYAPNTIKKAVTGRGKASKEQVSQMVTYILGGYKATGNDESDAIAVAICHIQRRRISF